jgi:hypothetical protein
MPASTGRLRLSFAKSWNVPFDAGRSAWARGFAGNNRRNKLDLFS